MGRHLADQVMVRRLAADGGEALVPDEVIVEEPMEIRLDDRVVTTTMRTPGNDFELAAGHCFAEGLLAGATVHDIRYCATGSAVETEFNVVTVGTGGAAPPPVERLQPTTSSCGLCGSASIEALTTWLTPLEPVAVSATALRTVAVAIRDQQALFARTGAVHAAAAFSVRTGEIEVVREDIGRHNAADKVIGRLLLDGDLPARDLGLFLSGRVSIEMVQKAWAAGFACVAAVGGPSSLAVETARVAGVALVAFVRDATMNVYVGRVE